MESEQGSGSGSRLPTSVLGLACISTLVAVLVSAMSIYLQLKNYRKPLLQRMVVRIMVMVPLYAISSLISLFSLEAAFVIDAIRDIYEAFVIYCFFALLLSYLGGERSLLILLHGRPPKDPVFPISLFKREIDVSDPYMFLFLKRGILQYVQVKPILAAATLILKALGKFNEGDFRANSGYLYVSIVYNASICLSLYCLAMFWMCVNDDLKPFRPVPKFLCVKGILFFSFWQSAGISILVAARVITRLGPYTDAEHISLGLTDTLICLEMPFFAFAHMYAFSFTDYIDPDCSYVARMPMYHAFRDAFGYKDVVEDMKATLRGEGINYREFEPAEGFIHQGSGRDRRIRAGLRYVKGGKHKYWLPLPTQPANHIERSANRAQTGLNQRASLHAPLFADEVNETTHLAQDLQDHDDPDLWVHGGVDDSYELPFGDLDEADEELFDHSKKYLFGDYNYPCIDVSTEDARSKMWAEEERVLRNERGAWFSPLRGSKGQAAMEQRNRPMWQGYGAVNTSGPSASRAVQATNRSYEGWSNERFIDHEQGVPVSESSDTRMRWLEWQSSNNRPSQSSYSRSDPKVTSDTSGPSTPGGTRWSGKGRIRTTSSASKDKTSSATVLLPDAVDLVVEDKAAEQEEQTRERRKGEPTARANVPRRIYRRGFVEPADAGRVEESGTEADRPDDDDDLDDQGEVTSSLEHIRPREGMSNLINQVVQGSVAESTAQSLHGRMILLHEYNEDNPWA